MRFVVVLLFASLLSAQSLTMVTGCSGPVPGSGGSYTVTAYGSGFTAQNTIVWNGAVVATTLVSDTQLVALLPVASVPPGTGGSTYLVTVSQPYANSAPVLANCVLVALAAPPVAPPVPPLTTWVSATKAVIAMSDADLAAALGGATWQQMVRGLLTALLAYLQAHPSSTVASPLGYIIPIPQQLELVRGLDPVFYAAMASARGQ